MEQELRLKSVSGELWGKIKRDPKTSRAVVVLAHGLGEHIQRYEHVAEAFDQRDFALMGFDQQGHGKSGGKRGVIAGNDSLIPIFRLLFILQATMAPNQPVFLYGHSMGALEALYYGLKAREKVCRASSPPARL